MGKLFSLSKVSSQKSGIILIIVLWTMALFTIIALSLSRGTHVDLTLAKYHVGKTISKYLAIAGVMYAVDVMKKDEANEDSKRTDTLYFLARPLYETRVPEELFKDVALAEGNFSLIKSVLSDGKYDYGLSDEESKININSLTAQNYHVLSSLIVLKGFDEKTADTIASSVVDWVDADGTPVKDSGAEDEYYQALSRPYHCKNHPFDAKAELFMIKGMSPEIFDAMEDDITIFPKIGNLRINFDTAPSIVLRALARGVAPGTDTSNPDSLVEKLILSRFGADGVEGTADDQAVLDTMVNLNAQESLAFNLMRPFRAKRSDFIRVESVGVESRQKVQTRIEAVVSREDFSVVSWLRE